MSVATMTRRIDFNNPTTNKPANLQNSAVLRMLEEEENRQRGGQPGSLKRVAWPPLRDDELEGFVEQAPVQSQGGPLYSSSKSETGPQNNQTPIEQKPSPISPVYQPPQTQQPKSPIINNSNSNTFQPIISPSPVTSSQQSAPQSPYQSAPLSPNVNKSPGIAQNQVPAQPRYQVPQKQVEPPPSTIILRPQAPVSQAPPPLVTSQPATATLRGGKNLRGDLKWPPETVRQKMQAEEEHLVELSKGPACKPRKNCKDYSRFFAKHALTHAYPGYKIPPGTQFYDHSPVM